MAWLVVGLGIALVTPVAALVVVALWLGRPTRGPAVGQFAVPRQALVLIDVQQDYTCAGAPAPFPYAGAEQMVRQGAALAEAAYNASVPVVFVAQTFRTAGQRLFSRLAAHGTALHGSSGAQLDPRLPLQLGAVVTKHRGDAFSNPQLDELLARARVNELWLMGLDARACVLQTALGARARGYTVHIMRDVTLTTAPAHWKGVNARCCRAGIHMDSASLFTQQVVASAQEARHGVTR